MDHREQAVLTSTDQLVAAVDGTAEEGANGYGNFFRVLAEHLCDGVVVLDDHHTIAYLTDTAAAALGGEACDLRGRPVELRLEPRVTRIDAPTAADDRYREAQPVEVRTSTSPWLEALLYDLRDQPVVGGWVLTLHDSARADRIEEFRRLAHRDPLTDLHNRRGFERHVERQLAAGRPVGIGFLDLDGFKSVNDRFGHAGGDQLLIQVAQRLRETVRASDMVARFGGDEFVVALCDLPVREQLARLTKRVVDAISGHYTVGDTTTRLEVSTGWSAAIPGMTVAEALHRADRRMYQQKRGPCTHGAWRTTASPLVEAGTGSPGSALFGPGVGTVGASFT